MIAGKLQTSADGGLPCADGWLSIADEASESAGGVQLSADGTMRYAGGRILTAQAGCHLHIERWNLQVEWCRPPATCCLLEPECCIPRWTDAFRR